MSSPFMVNILHAKLPYVPEVDESQWKSNPAPPNYDTHPPVPGHDNTMDQNHNHDCASSSNGGSSRTFKCYFLPCVTRQDSLVGAPSAVKRASYLADESKSARRGSQPTLSAIPCRDRRIQSLESGRLLRLTEDDLVAIRRSWDKIQDKTLWCQRMFLKLFSLRANLQSVMGYKNMSVKQILQCAHFELQCQRFVDFWHQIVNTLCAHLQPTISRNSASTLNVATAASTNSCNSCGSSSSSSSSGEADSGDPADRVVGKIRDLGLLHSQMPGVTFDADCWLVFKKVLIESVCGQQVDIKDKTCLGWCKLIMFVISEMKDAFNEGVRTRKNTA